MPKTKKLSAADQAAHEAEILNAPIDTSNKIVEAVMSDEFVQMSNLDASQIALLLQELVRGQNSLLAQQSAQIARIQERQEQIDYEIASRLEEQKKFIEEVLDRAERTVQRTGEANDKLIAQGVAQYQEAVQRAKADKITKDLQFKQKLMKEPKVMIVSPGQLATLMENGQQVSRIIPEEVHIKGIHMRLPIGVPVEVPETIAKYLAERRQSQQETAQLSEVLSKHLESNKLAEEWNRINNSGSVMPQ